MYEERPNLIQPALIGGVFLGVSSALPLLEWFNCACCLLVIGGGVLASYIYLREHPSGSAPVTYGDGAMLGMLTGVIGGLIWTAVEVPISFFKWRFGLGLESMSQLEELLDEPDIPPALQEFLSTLLAGEVLSVGVIIWVLLTHLLIALIFATIGGIIGVALFQSRAPVPPAPPSAPTNPPPR